MALLKSTDENYKELIATKGKLTLEKNNLLSDKYYQNLCVFFMNYF